MKLWLLTDKGDTDCRALVDGYLPSGEVPPHYSRQKRGSTQFTRNGQNLVLISIDGLSVWVTHRPKPGAVDEYGSSVARKDGLDAWECALFCRRGGNLLSSDLIREATILTYAIWGLPPADGLITYVKPSAIKSINPGCCYKKAGWRVVGSARDGKPMLRAPWYHEMYPGAALPDWGDWDWKEGRGGVMRKNLEMFGGYYL